jgi:hypothetical protein
MIYLLEHIKEIDEICENSVKLENLKITLVRKGLITDENKITLEGKQVLDFVSSPSEIKFVKNNKKDDSFDLWWAKYPATDSFTYKTKKFNGTRALRAKKPECKIKLNSILNEGEYSIEEIIGALELEVQQKKEASYKENKNKLSYMQNSYTYLNQRTFEAFIELFREGHKIEEKVLSNETYI